MSNSIQLNLVNQSNDTNNSTIVIFQKNEAVPDSPVVAWRVIQNSAPGDSHPFTLSADLFIAATDSAGNATPQVPASAGQQLTLQKTASGNQLVASGAAADAQAIELVNGSEGAINVTVYRDGALLATLTSVAPGKKALFAFNNGIWIGAVPTDVIAGIILDSAILNAVNTQIGLVNILDANIAMTGGGPGSPATPYKFSLAEVVEG